MEVKEKVLVLRGSSFGDKSKSFIEVHTTPLTHKEIRGGGLEPAYIHVIPDSSVVPSVGDMVTIEDKERRIYGEVVHKVIHYNEKEMGQTWYILHAYSMRGISE